MSTDHHLASDQPDEGPTAPTPRGPAGWASPRSTSWRDPSAAQEREGGVGEEQAPASAELAHWGLRVASYLVDFVAPFVVAGILIKVSSPTGVIAYVAAVAFVVWNLVVQGTRGQTVGKRFVGTKLVRLEDGGVVGPGLSILRYVTHIIDVLPLYLGFLWPLWDAKRQTFSDKICRTVVIVV